MASDGLRDFYEAHGLITRERLGCFLTAAAGSWPDRELIAYERKRYTYREIWRWAIAMAHGLVRHGVRPGDKVVVQAGNSVELLAVQFAIWRIGAICVPVLTVYRQHEMKAILRDIRPEAVVAVAQFRGRTLCAEFDELLDGLGVRPKLKLMLDSAERRPGWDWATPAPGPREEIGEDGLPEASSPDDCSVILYTSGTTSAPKGAMLTGAGILSQARSLARTYGLAQRTDVALCASPLAHTAALSYGVLMPMVVGARMVLLAGWNPDEAVKVIEQERVTVMSAPVLFLYDLVQRYERPDAPAYRIPLFNSGGGVNPPSLIIRADAVGIKATRNYGMTEVAGGCTLASLDDPLEVRAHYDGRALFGAEVGIVGPDRAPLPLGEVGEVRIRTPQLMIGYTDAEATAAQIDSDRWFYTGDLGSLNADGWLTITGRLKDIINRGGEKFSANDIEAALTTHPDISEAAVVGAPDERFGEVVAAFLKLKPDVEWAGPQGLIDHLEAAQLAKQKIPVQWHLIDEMPRTATGKVYKQALRESFKLES